jgi:N-acetylglucosaminyldiphosphoundecaprenol N-acetyl-beta-D-mannosaminyltransferase
MGVVLAGAVQGARVRRFTGPLLMEKSCEFGISQHWRHFFCGGAEGLALLLSHRLTARFPGLITAGIFCPPFRGLGNEEERRMIETINTAEPDILWVGLGVVRQELWIARYRGRLTVPWLVGVGGAFDYHAGTTPWAPKWVRRAGMEWMYRLCKEPWRFKRILSCYINLLEATLETALRRPVVLGNWRVDQPPQYRGRAKRPAHC